MTVFQVKGIRPAKLKVDSIRLELLNELRRQGKETETDLGKPVATWENKPKFESEISLAGGDAMVLTGPTGDAEAVKHFVWTDEGTPPHLIRRRRARTLRFMSKYTAKTRPGWIGSQRGGPSGDPVYAPVVHHPGTKARKFTEAIQKRRKKKFTEGMIAAMQRGASKAF